jgi:hypothetical protein
MKKLIGLLTALLLASPVMADAEHDAAVGKMVWQITMIEDAIKEHGRDGFLPYWRTLSESNQKIYFEALFTRLIGLSMCMSIADELGKDEMRAYYGDRSGFMGPESTQNAIDQGIKQVKKLFFTNDFDSINEIRSEICSLF